MTDLLFYKLEVASKTGNQEAWRWRILSSNSTTALQCKNYTQKSWANRCVQSPVPVRLASSMNFLLKAVSPTCTKIYELQVYLGLQWMSGVVQKWERHPDGVHSALYWIKRVLRENVLVLGEIRNISASTAANVQKLRILLIFFNGIVYLTVYYNVFSKWTFLFSFAFEMLKELIFCILNFYLVFFFIKGVAGTSTIVTRFYELVNI